MLLRFRIHRDAISAIAFLLVFVLIAVFMVGSVFGFRRNTDHTFFEISKITPLENGGVLLGVRLVDDPEIAIDLPVSSEVAKNRALKVGWRYHIDYRELKSGEYIVTNIN